MRTRHCLGLVLTVGMLLGNTPRADAAWKFFGWLDELSGPGPFAGWILTAEVACTGEMLPSEVAAAAAIARATGARTVEALEERLTRSNQLLQRAQQSRRCRYDRRNVRVAVVLEAGWWNDTPNPDYAGDVRLQSLQGVFYFPLRLFEREGNRRVLRSVELGGGVGVYRMSGAGVVDEDYWRGAFPLRIRLLPSEFLLSEQWINARSLRTRRLLQAFQIRGGVDFLPGFLASEQFVLTPNTRAGDSRNEWVPTFGLTVDLGAVFWSWINPRHDKYR